MRIIDWSSDVCSSDLIEAAIKTLEGFGAIISEISLPNSPLSVPTYYVVAPAEASSNLARFDGVRYGHRAEGVKTLEQLYKKSRGEGFGAEVQRRIMIGTYVQIGRESCRERVCQYV